MRASILPGKDQDLTDIQHFWYRIYVTEMQRHISDPLTDHRDQLLHDPLTQSGNMIVARDESREVIATIMTTIAANADLGKYEHLYGLDRLSHEQRQRSAITTKLMVAQPYRRSRLPMAMTIAAYKFNLEAGLDQNYIDCNDHLVGFFQKLGYQDHLGRIIHRDYGAVNSMVLQLRDAAHLRSVSSPLLKPLLAHNQQNSELHEQQSSNKAKEASHAA